MRHLIYILPLFLFLGLSVLLFSGLGKDPSHLPSALIGKPFPTFSLPDLHREGEMLDASVVKGKPSLVNIWATWCAACRVEHPQLMRIAREEGVPIIGVNYKDDPDEARAWLNRYENPYQHVIVDRHGRLGLDLGVYGAPETYVVDAEGIVLFRHVGVVDRRVWDNQLAPLLGRAGSGQ